MDLRDLRFVSARSTFKGILFEIPKEKIRHRCIFVQREDLRDWGHKPADITNVNSEGVRDLKQPFL